MGQNDWAVIVALAGVVSAMGGFIVFLFKDTLARADKRIESLEKREEEAIEVMAGNVATMLELLKTVVEIVKELRLVAELDRAARIGKGGP